MNPATYELRINADGTYCLIIQGAIKFDGLTFTEAISKIMISEAEGKENE